MKSLLKKVSGNVVALGLQDFFHIGADGVQKDGSGVPIAWRLFKFGPFSITREGETSEGAFTTDHAEKIIDYHRQKGNKIPIDSRHFLFVLAQKFGVEESAVAKLLAADDVTMGYGALALKADGLWLTDIDWVDLARQIMAEGVLRWFSPVVRGLQDGNLRITSVSMTNTPAIDQLDAIAASAEIEFAGAPGVRAAAGGKPRAENSPAVKKGAGMKGLLVALGALLGMTEVDAAALSAEGADYEAALLPKIKDLTAEVPALRLEKAQGQAFLGDLRTALALSAETTPEAARAAILGFVAKGKEDAAALTAVNARVQALETAKAEGEKKTLIEQGLAAGKLTPALVETWAKKQDAAALTAFLSVAPVIVPGGRIVDPNKLTPDSAALTAEDLELCKVTGQDPQVVAAAWKKHLEGK